MQILYVVVGETFAAISIVRVYCLIGQILLWLVQFLNAHSNNIYNTCIFFKKFDLQNNISFFNIYLRTAFMLRFQL